MSFIALDICGGRFAKGCSITGVVLHALSGDASYLPFSDNTVQPTSDVFPSRNGVAYEHTQVHAALRATALSSLFRIDLVINFITEPSLQGAEHPS